MSHLAHEATDEMGDFAARHPHPTFVDRMTEQYDMEDQSESAGPTPWLILLAVVLGAVTATGLAIRWWPI